MKKQTTIVYSPLICWLLINEIKKRAKIFFSKDIPLSGRNEWQNAILGFDFSSVPEKLSGFKKSAIAGDHRDHEKLQKFIADNQILMNVPMPPAPPLYQLNLTAIAFMELIQKWPEKHGAKKHLYKIKSEESRTGEEINVDGYTLKKVVIGVNAERKPVSALVELGDGILIQLSDTDAYTNTVYDFEEKVTDSLALYKMVTEASLVKTFVEQGHYCKTYLYAPIIDALMNITNHLEGIYYENTDSEKNELPEALHVTGSEVYAKIKLDENGVVARAEGYATARMVLGASADSSGPELLILEIKNGLVVNIYIGEQIVFTAYIPQKDFKTK